MRPCVYAMHYNRAAGARKGWRGCWGAAMAKCPDLINGLLLCVYSWTVRCSVLIGGAGAMQLRPPEPGTVSGPAAPQPHAAVLVCFGDEWVVIGWYILHQQRCHDNYNNLGRTRLAMLEAGYPAPAFGADGTHCITSIAF